MLRARTVQRLRSPWSRHFGTRFFGWRFPFFQYHFCDSQGIECHPSFVHLLCKNTDICADCSSSVCFLCAGPAVRGRPMATTGRADPGRGRTGSAAGCASAYDHEALPGIEITLILEKSRLTACPCFAGLLVKSASQMSSLHSDHWNVDFR